MKKTYINPELEVVKLQTMQMLAASSLSLNDDIQITDDSEVLAPGVDDFDFGMDEVFDMGTGESISNFE